MISRKELAQLRKLLASADRDVLQQGLDLVASLADPELTALVTGGIAIGENGRLNWDGKSELARRVKDRNRTWAALRLLAMAGATAGVTRLDLGHDWRHQGFNELGLLDAFPDLERLGLSKNLDQYPNLSPLSRLQALDLGSDWLGAATPPPLPALRELRFQRVWDGDAFDRFDAPALEVLDMGRANRIESLRGLEGFSRLKTLALRDADRLVDVSGVAALASLEVLQIEHCPQLADASPLAGLAALQELAITGSFLGSLPDLSAATGLRYLRLGRTNSWGRGVPLEGLAGLAQCAALEVLELSSAGSLTDLSPLSGLSALRRLDLTDCFNLQDLSPLAGLSALETLDLTRCAGLESAAFLAALPSLKSVSLIGCDSLTDLHALRGVGALTAELVVDETGQLAHGPDVLPGGPLTGAPLWAALHSGAEILQRVTKIDLRGCGAVRELSVLTELPNLREIALSRCANLVEPAPLGLMPSLERLSMEACTQAWVRPARASMATREAVVAYQRRIARALSKRDDLGPAQDAWLAAMTDRGLLQRVAKKRAPAGAKAIWKLLRSPERDNARQGVALLESLNDPALAAEFAQGLSLDAGGLLTIDRTITRRPHMRVDRRAWTALSLLRVAGALDGAERIAVPSGLALDELTPLAGLTGLTSLSIEDGRSVSDLTALSGLSGLTSLSLGGFQAPRDLASLAGLTGLTSLSLSGAWSLQDVSGLSGMSALETLTIADAQHLTDLSGLSGLTSLRALALPSASTLRDLSPLAGLSGLTRLSFRRNLGLLDLAPLAGLTGLRELDLFFCTSLRDVSALSGLAGLEILDLRSCWVLSRSSWSKRYEGAEATQKMLARIARAAARDAKKRG